MAEIKKTDGYKCPNCDAGLNFDATEQILKCDYCDNTFTVKQMEELSAIDNAAADQTQAEPDWDAYKEKYGDIFEGRTVYTCSSCGAQINGDANTAATECAYCGNPVVMAENLAGMLEPDYVIPFKLEKDAAMNALKAFYRGKKLLPKAFSAQNRIEKISGIYVPFWLFDCKANASMTFNAQKVRTWKSGNYRYTETSYFKIYRAGSMLFDKVPVDGSSKLEDNYMDAIEPFDYKEITEFKSAYLSGWLADKYDVDSKDAVPRANLRIKNSIVSALTQTVNGYSSVNASSTNFTSENGEIKYAMLPVWMLTTKWENKKYTFAMNGQTGKLIGELPVDKKKAWLWRLGIAAGVMALLNLILLLLGVL